MTITEIRKVGRDLKQFRKATGLSRYAFHKRTGLSANTIENLEEGDAKMLQRDTKKKIARLLTNDPAAYNGKNLPVPARKIEVPPMPSMEEVEKALGMDPNSVENMPPLVMTFGKIEVSIRVNP